MRLVQATLLFLFLGAMGAFALQNNALIPVRFLNWGMTAPISVLVVATYLLGMISAAPCSA